tara:strand:+ start:1801 stop:2544 length:744 start_codon:yes stop_codon:yes gene_type:complete
MDNCSEIAKFTLMVEYPWFKFRFFISLFLATLMCFVVPSSNKILYIIIFNIIAVASYYGIEIHTSKIIEQDQLTELIDRCNTERKVKKENFLNKLQDLVFEDPNKNPVNALNSKEEQNFNERAAVSLETVNKKKDIETFANPYPNDTNSNNDFRDNISMNSFKNLPAAFESTYEMIHTPPLLTPPSQVGPNDCLLGKDKCNPICSGNNENPCDLQTPSPGPQWQPQHASSIQNRLNNGSFVPNQCPL